MLGNLNVIQGVYSAGRALSQADCYPAAPHWRRNRSRTLFWLTLPGETRLFPLWWETRWAD